MDEWWRSESIPFSLSLTLCCFVFFLYLLLFSLIFFPFSSSLSQSLSLSSPPVISSLAPSAFLNLSLRGFHLDLQTPPPGATLITYGGNRKCGLKSKLKWVFHCRLLIFWWQNTGSCSQNIFHQVCARHHFG